MRKGCVCVCVVGLTAVSNGSCLTGPWEMESKRSIRYNVNNDPSFHCAARDKSIKDPSHPVITILCQQHTERQRVRGKGKEKKYKGMNTKTQGNFQSCSAEQRFTLCQKMFAHIQWRAAFFSMHLLVICLGRFVAQWNASSSGVIPLPPHWLPINEAISTNTFWHLWKHFWKGVWMTLLTNTQVAGVSKSNSFEEKRGVCSEWLRFTPKVTIALVFLVAFNSWGREVPLKVAFVSERSERAGLNSSACHCDSPEKGQWRNICHFFGPYVCEFAIWGAPQTRMSSEQWRQLQSTVSDMPHVEFSLQRKVKQVTHACNTIRMTRMNGGRYGQLRLGKASAALGPPACRHHPHTSVFTQILTGKNSMYFFREDRGHIHSSLRQKTWVTSSLTLLLCYRTRCDPWSPSMHTNTQTCRHTNGYK